MWFFLMGRSDFRRRPSGDITNVVPLADVFGARARVLSRTSLGDWIERIADQNVDRRARYPVR